MLEVSAPPLRRRPACESRGRILLVQYSANFGGSTVSGRLLAEGLIRNGWDVDVVFGFSGPYAKYYEARGCTAHVIEHENWLRPGSLIRKSRRLLTQLRIAGAFARLMRELRPAVVYVNSLASLPPVLAARRMRIPCVWHVRELFENVGGEMSLPAIGGEALVRRMLGLCDHVVAISQAVAMNVVGARGTAAASIIPNAAGPEFFESGAGQDECRRRLDLPQNVPVIGVPGTLRPVKGHPFLIEAASQVVQRRPDCHFAIAGEGTAEYRKDLESLLSQAGLAERVRLLGTVADMPAFYRACDVICVPSRSEPFGRTVVEAFAAGVPVVATCVDGIAETITDGETGLLVRYGHIEALAAGIVRLLDDSGLRGRLIGQARRKAEKEYCEEVYHDRICRVVNRVARPLCAGNVVQQ